MSQKQKVRVVAYCYLLPFPSHQIWFYTSCSDYYHHINIFSFYFHYAGLRSIDVQVPDSIAESFHTPGQYCQIISDGKPGFYAIRSPPDKTNVFSFIIKQTENNERFANGEPGSKIDLSDPQGSGFKIAEYFDRYKYDFPTTRVLMMACGSGIAPIASAIDSNLLGFGSISYNSLFARKGLLYLGVQSEKHIPCQKDFDRWEDAGIKIVPVCSRPTDRWKGDVGYIQDVLRKENVEVPRNTGALLCGHR
jgi:NAD(P)H-flavin reductase